MSAIKTVRMVAAALPLVVAASAVAPAEAAVTCLGKTVTINLVTRPGSLASSGDDVIWGTNGSDTIDGFGGDDTICARDGNDTIDGDVGNDIIAPGLGDDTITGSSGSDTVDYRDALGQLDVDLGSTAPQPNTGVGTDTFTAAIENLVGGPYDDKITGTSAANVIKSRGGQDEITPGIGNDTLKGGGDHDILVFAALAGPMTLDLAVSTPQTSAIGTKTIGGIEAVVGTASDDVIRGNDAQNFILGSGGNDILYGRTGNDVLGGGDGSDILRGGAGEHDLCSGGENDGNSTDEASGCEHFEDYP